MAKARDNANEEKIIPIPNQEAPRVSAKRGRSGMTIPIPSMVEKTAT
jgi:hypothetical protein